MTRDELSEDVERLAAVSREIAARSDDLRDILVFNCLSMAALAGYLEPGERAFLLAELTRLAKRFDTERN